MDKLWVSYSWHCSSHLTWSEFYKGEKKETKQYSFIFKCLGFWLTYHATRELRPLLPVVWEDQQG